TTAAATAALGAAAFTDAFTKGAALSPEAAHARARASRIPDGHRQAARGTDAVSG
ncbi:hypothetical protein G3I46_18410, partial [Streptomyces coelicoflavus]|nr:hypothetical protein [Streptomyces coelicoflavus]